jgi:uncharacterized lipoprotein YajG
VKVFALVMICAAMSACAFNPQQAKIAPALKVAATTEGNGTAVALRVLDERDSKSIGNRGTAYGKAAKITSAEDVGAIVHNQIVAGLTAKGFKVIPFDAAAPVTLTVELRALNYDTSTGFWTGGVEIKSALKAIARRGTLEYEKFYRSDEEKRVAVVPTAAKNEEWINASLTDVLTQLFDDIGLMRHLAGSTGT